MPSFRQLSHYYRNRIPNNGNIEQQYFWEGFTNQANIGLVKSALGDIYEGFIAGNEIPGKGDEVAFIPGIPIGQIFVRQFVQPEIVSVAEPVPVTLGCYFLFALSIGNGRYVTSSLMNDAIRLPDLSSLGAVAGESIVANGIQFTGNASGNWVASFATERFVASNEYEFKLYLIAGNSSGVTSTNVVSETIFDSNPSGFVLGMADLYTSFSFNAFLSSTSDMRLYQGLALDNTSTSGNSWIDATTQAWRGVAGGVWRDDFAADGILSSNDYITASTDLSVTIVPGTGAFSPSGLDTAWDAADNVYKMNVVNAIGGTASGSSAVFDRAGLTLTGSGTVGPFEFPGIPSGTIVTYRSRFFSGLTA